MGAEDLSWTVKNTSWVRGLIFRVSMMMETVITRTIVTGLMVGALLQAQNPIETTAITLDQAIQEAISKNLDLVAQRLSVSVAETREITARLRPNPVLTVAGQSLTCWVLPILRIRRWGRTN